MILCGGALDRGFLTIGPAIITTIISSAPVKSVSKIAVSGRDPLDSKANFSSLFGFSLVGWHSEVSVYHQNSFFSPPFEMSWCSSS